MVTNKLRHNQVKANLLLISVKAVFCNSYIGIKHIYPQMFALSLTQI